MIINPYRFASDGGGDVFPDFPTALGFWAAYEPFRQYATESDGDSVTAMTDQTSNGRNGVQATSGNRARWRLSQIASLPAWDFADPTARFYTLPNMSSFTSLHWFMVIKSDADPMGANLQCPHQIGTAGDPAVYPYSDSNVYETMGRSNRIIFNPTGNLAAWHLYEVYTASGGTWRFKYNGTTEYTVSAAFACSASPTVGKVSFGSFPYYGKIAGIWIKKDAEITGTDYTDFKSYINTVYGLTIS